MSTVRFSLVSFTLMMSIFIVSVVYLIENVSICKNTEMYAKGTISIARVRS